MMNVRLPGIKRIWIYPIVGGTGELRVQKRAWGNQQRHSLEARTWVNESEIVRKPRSWPRPAVVVRPQKSWCRNPREAVGSLAAASAHAQWSMWLWWGPCGLAGPGAFRRRAGCSVQSRAGANWELATSLSLTTVNIQKMGNSNLEPLREGDSGNCGPQHNQADYRNSQPRRKKFRVHSVAGGVCVLQLQDCRSLTKSLYSSCRTPRTAPFPELVRGGGLQIPPPSNSHLSLGEGSTNGIGSDSRIVAKITVLQCLGVAYGHEWWFSTLASQWNHLGSLIKYWCLGCPQRIWNAALALGFWKAPHVIWLDSQGWESLERQELQLGRLILLFSGPFYFPMQQ